MSSDVCLCGPQPPHAHQPRALPDRRALHHLPLQHTRGRRHHVDANRRRHSRWRRPRPSSDCVGAVLGALKRTTRRSASGSGIGRHRGTTDAYRGNGARRRGEGPSTAPRERGSVSTPLDYSACRGRYRARSRGGAPSSASGRAPRASPPAPPPAAPPPAAPPSDLALLGLVSASPPSEGYRQRHRRPAKRACGRQLAPPRPCTAAATHCAPSKAPRSRAPRRTPP